MIHTDSIKILTFDLSYRDTGWSLIKGSREKKEYSFYFGHVPNPVMKTGFDGLKECYEHCSILLNKINDLYDIHQPDICLIEVPSFSQSDMGAIACGLMWGMMSGLNFIPTCVSPQQLKTWSESKKGDGKEFVKQKVTERVELGLSKNNDNVIDAIGLGLMMLDYISISQYGYSR